MQKLFRSLLAVGVVLGLAACGDDVTVSAPPEATLVISGAPSGSIQVGQTVQLSANLPVDWASNNASVASVGSSGLVTAVAAGVASITATASSGSGQTASATITVTAPGVQSVVVNPHSATLTVGQTITPVATVNRDAGVAGTVTWGTSDNAIATVNSSTGLVTAVATGNAVISAVSTVDNSKSDAMSLQVIAQSPALQSLSVTPGTVSIGPGGTQTTTTIVSTVAGASVSYANSTSNPAVATVTTTGANPVITGVANGTAVITVTATGSAAGYATNSISQTVTVTVTAAAVSISSLTTCVGGPPCVVTPVNLAGTLGQIEATMNITSGSQSIDSVAVFIDATEAASQVFGVNGAPQAPVTLSIATNAFGGMAGGPCTNGLAAFMPCWTNGQHAIQAKIFPHGAQNPTASNTIAFTLVNPDVVYFDNAVGTTANGAGLNHTGNSAAQANNGSIIWWKGGFTFMPHPVLYSGAANVTSITYTSTACGVKAATAAPWAATFTCAGVESAQSISNVVAIAYVAGYTLTVSPTAYMTAATAGYVPGQPVYATVTTREDNVGPVTATPLFTNAGANGWHGNGSAGVDVDVLGSPNVIPGTSYSVSATDAGVGGGVANAGLASLPTINEVTLPQNNVTAANQLTETASNAPYQLQGTAVNDVLGNTGTASALTTVFGVDLQVLDARYADHANSGAVGTGIWQGTNGTIYTAAAVTGGAATDWENLDGGAENIAADAIDSRSGLNNATALTQKIVRSNPGGTTVCLGATTYPMTTILVDNYVQSAPQQFDCGLAAGSRVGEYTWTGYVSDRAGNARLISDATGAPPTTGTITSLYMAIDEALPNVTGIGFQTGLYTGGQPATYTFSANDDLELKDGQVTLTYGSLTPTITYPYGSSVYSSGPFGVPFDGTFVNVLNNQPLTIDYYVVRWDMVDGTAFAAPATGNVAGATSSGINSAVTANVEDVANQPSAAPLVAPLLSTQIQDRAAMPAYSSVMIHWQIQNAIAGGPYAEQISATNVSGAATLFCDRVDIYEADAGVTATSVNAGATTNLIYRATIAAPNMPYQDNGINGFHRYRLPALTAVASGLYTAACVKSGSALFSYLY